MEYESRWHVIGVLGQGGQGKVYRVLDASKFNIDKELRPGLRNSLVTLAGSSIAPEKSQKENFELFRKIIVKLGQMENHSHHGALKVLHEPGDAKDADRAEDRIKMEIEAMSEISHPNILKILDHDPEGRWFVSEFHPKGTLVKNEERFTGDFVGSLKAFRPLVEGVSKLHENEKGRVHRDIKPQNVFLDANDNLVLGDFGLVFFSDEKHTRVSGTFENVGSRDWMPGWAFGMRIKDIKPTFDVFSLGKLLWAMVSNKPILQLWYFDRPQFDLEEMFPNAPSIKLANQLFTKCIVQDEENCLPDATALLEEIDKVLSMIDMNADLIGDGIARRCKVCGMGYYELILDRHSPGMHNFGLRPAGTRSFKVFTCNHCGHVQLFTFDGKQDPPAWVT